MTTTLAVDCMGGAHGPRVRLAACRNCLAHLPEAHLVLVGAPGAKRGLSAADEAVGTVTLLNLDGRRVWTCAGSQAGERFGAAVAALPGASVGNAIKFLVGAPGWQNQLGRAYFVATDGQVPQVISGEKLGAQLGAYVGLGPDLDGDGQPSFVIGEDGVPSPSGVPGISTIFQAFVRPQIKSVRKVSAGRFELSIRGEAGVRYELQATGDLSKWEKVGSLLATGNDDRLTINSALPHRFYRLVVH